MSECGRNFEEIYKQHHSPERNIQREIDKNRKNYGYKGI